MDFGKAFTYPFEDKDWVAKILIGGILSLIPIVNLVVLGYVLKVLRNVADGVEKPLPAWDDFADYFVKGIMAALGSLVWALPLIVLVMMSAAFSAITGSDSGVRPGQAEPFWICIWGLSCLSGLYGLFLGVVLPAAFTKYAVTNEFGAFFRFGEIFRFIRSNVGNYIIVLLLIVVAQFIAGFGVILCFVGVVFTEFWASLVMPHLLGQLYRLRPTPAAEPAA